MAESWVDDEEYGIYIYIYIYIYLFLTFGCRVYNVNEAGRHISDSLLLIERRTKNVEPCEGGVVIVLLLVSNAIC
jgi:hypothetical protein